MSRRTKFLFQFRKSKFREAGKLGEMVAGDATVDPFNRSGTSAREMRDSIGGNHTWTVRKWMGVCRWFPFIATVLLVCSLPSFHCFPHKKGAELRVFRSRPADLLDDSVSDDTDKRIAGKSEFFVGFNQSDFGRDWNRFGIKLKYKLKLENWSESQDQKGNGTRRHGKRHAGERARRKPFFVTDDVQNYLMTFGYLPPSDKETGLLRTDDQLRSAIRNLQSFAHIPATGELDEKTLELLKKPRCGLPDFQYQSTGRRKRYTLHGQKWPYTNLTWSLRTLQPRNLDGGRVRGVLYHALDVWAKHSKLTFQELNSDRADILVYFHSGYHGDGYAFDGRGQVLAHAFFPGKERGGDAHFDEDEVWLLDPYADLEQMEGTSLFAVAAHEFGHSLGLSHSSVQGALMFPWYQGYEGLTPDLQLPDDDKHAIQQLYGPKDTKLWAKIPTYEPYQPEVPRPEPPRTPPPPSPTRPPRPTRPTRPPTTTPAPRPWTPRPTFPPHPPTPPRRPSHPHPHPHPRPHPHPHPHPHPPRPKIPDDAPGKPDTCNTSYDAISIIRHEVFIFKDRYLWRIDDRGLKRDYPAEITRLWYGLPESLTHVDAVYERSDKKIVFFIGKMYYVFDANFLMPGYPKPIHYLGLPRELEKVDAAMVWGHNGKTYFFSGTMYWRFDEDVGRVELDYPRDMSMWRGVGYNIDAVFQWKDGKTYFFKNKGFWKFNDMRMRVENERQTLSAPFWMGCPKLQEEDDVNPNKPTTKRQTASSSTSATPSPVTVALISLISAINFYCLFVSYGVANVFVN